MRILQILPELHVGGVETGTVDFARYLKDNGHHPVVISNGGAMVKVLDHHGIRHYALPVHKKSLWTMMRMVKAVRKIIRDERIHIVHARSRVPGWIAYFACRKTEAQFITTCHGHYGNRLFSRVMGWPKRVIVPSEVIGHHMIDDYGVPPENIRCIPRSVDLKRFKIQHEWKSGQSSFIVSIVGRITPLKGHSYFLQALAKVVRTMPYVRIRIIGDAPRRKPRYREDLELQAQRLGLKDQVEFLGRRDDVPQLLAESDVMVMASTTPESFGRVILEAFAVGVPVVATSVGGVVEIIEDEKTGLLVMPKDTDAMASAVLRVLREPALGRRLVANAKKKLRSRYSVKQMSEATLKVYEELRDCQNILVIKLSAIGDVILVTPALKALRRKFPRARITCLVGMPSRRVLQRCPYIDEIMPIDTKLEAKGVLGLWRFSRKLRAHRFDKVIDLQNNHRSHLLAFLSCARETYGYRNRKLGFLLTNPVPRPDDKLTPVPHQFQVLRLLGIPYSKKAGLELWPAADDERHVQSLFDENWLGHARDIVGVNLSASEKWATKNWPPEHIAKLCDLLGKDNIRVVLTGMDKDRRVGQDIINRAQAKPALFAGQTDVMQLAALIKHCRVYVTPDSAPLHIAAAVGTPVIALFGPTDPARHLPPAKKVVVLTHHTPCQPCYNHQCRIGTQDCLRNVTPEHVAAQIRAWMSPV